MHGNNYVRGAICLCNIYEIVYLRPLCHSVIMLDAEFNQD